MTSPAIKLATNTEVVIEKGVPLPNMRTKAAKYPFGQMQVGDSFVLPEAERHRVTNAGNMHSKVNGGGRKFSIRKIGDGMCRCWRTA